MNVDHISPESTPSPSSGDRTWTLAQKYTLLWAIERHGDVRLDDGKLVINWPRVEAYCRNVACFGDHMALKKMWRRLERRARSRKNGTKFDRKVARFLKKARAPQSNT